MSTHPQYRYRVTSVWGDMEGRLGIGSIIVDYDWDGQNLERDWTTINLDTFQTTGGFSGHYLGRRKEELKP